DVVVRGYEVAVGLGEAMRGPYRLAGGTWPTLAVGGVTAAAVTCWLLDAAPEELAAAVVLAAHQSTLANPRGNAREVFLASAVVGVRSVLGRRCGGRTGSPAGPGPRSRSAVSPPQRSPAGCWTRHRRSWPRRWCSPRNRARSPTREATRGRYSWPTRW